MKLSKTRWTSGGSVAVTRRFNHARDQALQLRGQQLGRADRRSMALPVEGVNLRTLDGRGKRIRRPARPVGTLRSDQQEAGHGKLLKAEVVEHEIPLGAQLA